jgi:Mrp family chromosome partitioning ATPase
MNIKIRKVVNKMINITTFNDLKSPISEAYRSIRTNLKFSKLDNDMRTIVVTSSKQDEGKTTVAPNLAVSFAELERKRVLIIDADLRNSSIYKMFNKPNTFGLTDVLTGKKQLKNMCKQQK